MKTLDREPIYLSAFWEPGAQHWFPSAIELWGNIAAEVLGADFSIDARACSVNGKNLTAPMSCSRSNEIVASAQSGVFQVSAQKRTRGIDFVTYLEGEEAAFSYGYPAPPSCVLSWCLNCLSLLQVETLAHVLTGYFVAACRSWNCHYGLIEIGRGSDTRWGRVHCLSDSTGTNFPRRILVNILNHRRVGDLCARGVFWANWFGPEMCARLGGARQLVEEFAHRNDGKDYDLGEIYGEAALLTLTRDVRAMLPPYLEIVPWTIARAAWLYSRLGRAKLLPGLADAERGHVEPE